MKSLLIALMLFAAGCSTTTQDRSFRVHPDDMARFRVDNQRCYELAMVSRQGNSAVIGCLANIGYEYR